jgi:hypothetical protein
MHHVTSSPLQVPINGTGLPTNQECHLPTNCFSYRNFLRNVAISSAGRKLKTSSENEAHLGFSLLYGTH